MKKKLYAIIDIETTGGKANRDKITEIAIALHDGHQVIDEFQSLINPERGIPSNITKITGITDEMVIDAPKFYEVAKEIVEFTQGAIFVAHNVRFDYNFIREEFKRLGYTYTRKQLCTVRLSRQAFPGLRSYSLGNLISHFNIKTKQRHRAMADVKATVDIFERILRGEVTEERVKDMINLGVKESQLPKNIKLEHLHQLPEECGVYYFYDFTGDIVYVGKSLNIKKRVMEHFAKQTPKAQKLQRLVHEITYEITGSELIALLQESHEIKHHHPYINKAQRAREFQHILFTYENEDGYTCFNTARATEKQKQKKNVLRSYSTAAGAKSALKQLLEEFELCQVMCNMHQTGSPCFYYHLDKCHGACMGEELVEDYNERAADAMASLEIDFREDFIIVDKGRHLEEKAVVLIEDGQYQGFGYLETNEAFNSLEQIKDAVKPFKHNPEVVRIIQHFLFRGKVEKVVKL